MQDCNRLFAEFSGSAVGSLDCLMDQFAKASVFKHLQGGGSGTTG
jgi:hypothetical protein